MKVAVFSKGAKYCIGRIDGDHAHSLTFFEPKLNFTTASLAEPILPATSIADWYGLCLCGKSIEEGWAGQVKSLFDRRSSH
jgi:hypothetical protein